MLAIEMMRIFMLVVLAMMGTGAVGGAAGAVPSASPVRATEHVLLVMTDGLRWQEFFNGADAALLQDSKAGLLDYAPATTLLPFIATTMAKEGLLLGDPARGSRFAVANGKNYSYPGYNEALTGVPDASITGNEPIPNKNPTILDQLAAHPGFAHHIAAVASWDVMFAIINVKNPGIIVMGGRRPPPLPGPFWASMGRLATETPTPWPEVQYDALTHEEALELLAQKPKLLLVSYGETDEWAHKNDYLAYLKAAHRFDDYVRQLWEKAQATEGMKGHTTLIITTDHGRGDAATTWQSHGAKLPMSDRTWLGIMGPDTDPQAKNVPLEGRLQQVAATIYQLLGLTLSAYNPRAALPLEGLMRAH